MTAITHDPQRFKSSFITQMDNALSEVRTVTYDTLGSTNGEALKLARAGERGPLWIIAKQQTAGRGRRGHTWVSPRGNLYATLLLCAPSAPEKAAQLSFVAALGLHDSVTKFVPQLGPLLSLKWPNDLLLGQAKLAGILIESENEPTLAVAIGIGVNCISHPSDTAYPATNLFAHGVPVTPERLFDVMSHAMMCRIVQWKHGDGFAAIRADWLKRAAGLGQNIKVRLPEREFSGRFEGLDEEGKLVVQTSKGLSVVASGEVFGFTST
jgi:BirA family transcriptional regulator, biotin operon repressor / biotin---[acetyl-CoA-carboxylase] ligase